MHSYCAVGEDTVHARPTLASFTATTSTRRAVRCANQMSPGSLRWSRDRTTCRSQELVQTHLDTPQPDLLGQTLAQVILTERAETWVSRHRGETRRRILAPIANRLLHPAELPPRQPLAHFPRCADSWTSSTAASPSPRPATSTGVSSSRARTGSGATSPARRGPRTSCSTCTRCATWPRIWGWPAGRAAR
jgi:hypothetical protein